MTLTLTVTSTPTAYLGLITLRFAESDFAGTGKQTSKSVITAGQKFLIDVSTGQFLPRSVHFAMFMGTSGIRIFEVDANCPVATPKSTHLTGPMFRPGTLALDVRWDGAKGVACGECVLNK